MIDLKELRSKLKWSQERLALFLGYTGRQAVSKVERGDKEMGGSAGRLLELLKLYDKDAPRLWLPAVAKKIKQILNDDENDTGN